MMELGIAIVAVWIGIFIGMNIRDRQFAQVCEIQQELDRLEQEYNQIGADLTGQKPVRWYYRTKGDKGTVIKHNVNLN